MSTNSRKRDANNKAVKKCRATKNKQSELNSKRLEELIKQNKELCKRVEQQDAELKQLKDLLEKSELGSEIPTISKILKSIN